MRILLDLQGCQSASHRRGIGRYSLALSKAITQHAGEHEIWLLLNGLFPDSVTPLRQEFAGHVPAERIVVFSVPGSVAECNPVNSPRARVAELVREHAITEIHPDVVHIGSLFEGFGDDAVTSVGSLNNNIPTSVTLYDLIPLLNPTAYLDNQVYRDYYLRKIESLKRADLLLPISASAGLEAVSTLAMPQERVIEIGAAADERFRPDGIAHDEAVRILQRLGLDRPFVFYVGVIEPRKNFDRLIRAFASLPLELRTRHQLLLVAHGDDDGRERFRRLADSLGLTSKSTVIIDHVPDDELVALYSLCRLFVFPSLHEGFGLPALEAMSCGAAVIGSNATSIPEVIGREDALFDPTSPSLIAEVMGRALADESFRQSLREHGKRQAKRFSWDTTAKRALDAMAALCVRPSIRARSSVQDRPSLAFVSPLPPERTGIADYVAEVLPELSRHYNITLINDLAETSDTWSNENLRLRSIDWFRQNAGRFARILYQFGNSPFHAHMFELLERHPGIVVLHDFYLSSALNWMEESEYQPHAFSRALYRAHGYGALISLSEHGGEAAKAIFPANLPVLRRAQAVIVHSAFSLALTRKWYRSCLTEKMVQVPFPRVARPLLERKSARDLLGLTDDAFLVCSFGSIDSTKLSHRLLDAWLGAGFAADSQCHLVFVGENHGGKYGQDLVLRIRATGRGRVDISGFVETERYHAYLAGADVGVQLRAMSRGETSAAVFDCIAHGLPLVVNAHGSAAELPPEAVVLVDDEFTDEALGQALTRLRENDSLRSRLAESARRYCLERHSPTLVAEQYRDAIEESASPLNKNAYTTLLKRLGALGCDANLASKDLIATAESIASNLWAGSLPQLLLDVSEIARHDLRTGIERVARGLSNAFLRSPPAGWRVEPMYRRGGKFRYARGFTSQILELGERGLVDGPVEAKAGDIYLCLGWSPEGVLETRASIDAMRRRGVLIAYVAYDVLPLQFPHHFPDFVHDGCHQWLDGVSQVADELLGISKSTSEAILDWLEINQPRRSSALRVGYFHLGADILQTAPTGGVAEDACNVLDALRARPTFLMVGTVEPRKGHPQALDAFELLWQQDKDLNFAIVGKQGWMVDGLCERLRAHPEVGRRLFWLEGISDEYLERVYAASTCLIAASEGEGFGLPLIEAAKHGLPILARDIPVFREVAGEHAFYFSGSSPRAFAEAVREWLLLDANGAVPSSDGMRWMTWAESAHQLWTAIHGSYVGLYAPESVRKHALDSHLLLIHQARLRIVRELLPKGEQILDLGGANSPLHKMGYPHQFRRLIMIDLPAIDRHEMYKEIVVDHACESGDVVIRYQDMTRLEGIADCTMDLVWSGQSIEHVPPDAGARMCKEAWRVLRPGGVFALDTPNRLLTKLHTRSCGGGFIHPEHCIEYRPDELRQLLENAGFTVDAQFGICEMPETVRSGVFHYEDFLYGQQISTDVERAYIQCFICKKPVNIDLGSSKLAN